MPEIIEHIIKQPIAAPTRETPIMLMHGAWHGAWCWEHWMGYFAALGYEVHAISLPGHAGSSMVKGHINRYSIKYYVNILTQEIEKLERPPILIGHSMGGAITQKYLETHTPAAAVLLAPIPQRGLMGMIGRQLIHNTIPFLKANLTLNTFHMIGSERLTKEAFFTSAADIDLKQWFESLVRESFMAVVNTILPFADASKAQCPVLVQAGELDTIFTVSEEQHTAEKYGAKLIVYEGQGHNLMAEPQWQKVAEDVHRWATAELRLP